MFLAKAIESIREQNYENWELVVVDDASQDNVTLDILDYYSSDERIHIHKLSHNYGNGIFAKNYALAHAKGDFVAILDDDDISYPNRLSVCVETFIQNPEYDVIGSPVSYYTLQGNHIWNFPAYMA